MAETVKIKKCCAICDYYNTGACLLNSVFEAAKNCGCDDFELKYKWKNRCDNFELHECLEDEDEE